MRIYISAPYSSNPFEWTKRVLDLGTSLLDLGHTPFLPHLTHFWDFLRPRPYQDWLDYDLEWLRQCDLVLRIEGESKGVGLEVAEALRLAIPVVSVSLIELERGAFLAALNDRLDLLLDTEPGGEENRA